jgi:membrane-bound lytic murein transglycosylase MltF
MAAPAGRRWTAKLALAGAVFIAFAAGSSGAERTPLALDLTSIAWSGDLDGMSRRRIIRVLVPYSKTLYFVDYGGQQRGMSYDFMHAFEAELNSGLARGELPIAAVFIPVSRDQLIPLLLAGHGDVVAANLTITPERSRLVDFVTPVATGVREVIVTGQGAAKLNGLDDLVGQQVLVQLSSSYYASLTRLNEQFRRRGLAPMILRGAPGHFETDDLLEMANAGLVNVVVADSYLADFWSQIYPAISVHNDLVVRTAGDIAFAIRKNSPLLKAQLDQFTRAHRAGTLFGNVVLKKYLLQTKWAKNALSQADRTRFTNMVALFRKYGERYSVDWLLMAAQGYQESQLDQQRSSQVGAIGVMQLMPATGREMNVGDVTQLEFNIHAGVKYMRLLVDTYFKDPAIDPLNKLLFAFAAYNAGPGRMRSLRNEARSRNLDPNLWFNNVERVAAERIGRETVQYVANIYKYYVAYTLVQEEVERDLRKANIPTMRPSLDHQPERPIMSNMAAPPAITVGLVTRLRIVPKALSVLCNRSAMLNTRAASVARCS